MKESYKKFLMSGFINTDLKHPKNFLAGLPKKIEFYLIEPENIVYSITNDTNEVVSVDNIYPDDLPYSDDVALQKSEELKKLALEFYKDFGDTEDTMWVQYFVQKSIEIILDIS